MSLQVYEGEMTATNTAATAIKHGNDQWVVSWVPGRMLTRNQATTAVLFADVAALQGWAGMDDPDAVEALTASEAESWKWARCLRDWAAELDLDFAEALSMLDSDIPQGSPYPEPKGKREGVMTYE